MFFSFVATLTCFAPQEHEGGAPLVETSDERCPETAEVTSFRGTVAHVDAIRSSLAWGGTCSARDSTRGY